MHSLAGVCRPSGVFVADRGGIGTARRGTRQQAPLPAVAAGAGRRAAQPDRRRTAALGACRTALCRRPDLRDFPPRFVGLLCRTALPAGRADRVAARAPLRPAGRHRRLAGAGAGQSGRGAFPEDRYGRYDARRIQGLAFALQFGGFAPLRRSRGFPSEEGVGRYAFPYQEALGAGLQRPDPYAHGRRAAQRNGSLRRGSAAARTADGQKPEPPEFRPRLLFDGAYRQGAGRRGPDALLSGRVLHIRPARRHPLLFVAVRSGPRTFRPQGLRPGDGLHAFDLRRRDPLQISPSSRS